jgi:flagellar hook-associated protein 3 FlgL
LKISQTSTLSLSQNLRLSLLRTQNELSAAQVEVTTGRLADRGLALGARSSLSVTLARDLERVRNITDTNALAKSRLAATQNALGDLGSRAQGFLSTLTAGVGGDAGPSVLGGDARATLEMMTAVLNSALNGEYLFAGINTDVEPLTPWKPGSPAKTGFDAAFVARFGFPPGDPAASGISKADMQGFLASVEPQFLGAGWADWSAASDAPIQSRIALNETAPTSVSANADPIRKLAMAASTVSELMAGALGPGAREAVVERAVALVSEAIAGLGQLQSDAGISQKRVSEATLRLEAQADLFERHIGKLEGVDPYEASTRVSQLMDQIEMSYTLTARLGELSLMRFLR